MSKQDEARPLDHKLIENMRSMWAKYIARPATGKFNLAALNDVSYMGERMGRVIEHVDTLNARIDELEAQLERAHRWLPDHLLERSDDE
jgi:hypothetical protein